MTSHIARISVDPAALLDEVATAYRLGAVNRWAVLTTGYEDCNFAADTTAGPVVVKVFGPARPAGLATRTASLIEAVRLAGVRHPALHRTRHGGHTHLVPGHQVLVMDRVPGSTFYDLRRPPTAAELAAVLRAAACIHSVDLDPGEAVNPWAITELETSAKALDPVLNAEQRRLVQRAVSALAAVDRVGLPQALIHGDLTTGNVLVEPNRAITVLDLAVAVQAPRVQELAVVAANLTHGTPSPLPQRAWMIAEAYDQVTPVPLTAEERAAMPAYARAASAMELLGALEEWHHHGTRNAETEYLIGLGLAGLRESE